MRHTPSFIYPTGLTMLVKISDAFKAPSTKTKVSGTWRDVIDEFVKVDGVWRKSVRPSKELTFAFLKKTNAPFAVYHGHLIGVNSRVYSFGGRNSSGAPIANVAAFNPSSNSWANVTPMPVAIANATYFTTGTSGLIIVMGGVLASGGYNPKVYRYNAPADQWVELTFATDQVVPYDMTLSPNAYVNGNNYIVSTKSTDVYSFSLAQSKWTTIASASPFGAQKDANAQTSGFVQVENSLWISGGRLGAQLYRYDVLTNTWTKMANMPLPTLYGHQMFYSQGRLYTIGGWNGQAAEQRMFVYDIPTNTWSISSVTPGYANYQNRVAILNNILYVAQGSSNGGDPGVASDFWQVATLPT